MGRVWPQAEQGAVEEQLCKIFSNGPFARSERLKAFLGFVVRRHLDGYDAEIKEYTIGIEVFGKPPDFDPSGDSTVRVGASRLRSELETYYATEGENDEIVITLPKGHYVPEIARRVRERSPGPHTPRPRVRWVFALAAAMVAFLVVTVSFAFRSGSTHIGDHPPTVPGRLLVRTTSEGTQPRRIPLSHVPDGLAISPGGDKVFAISGDGRVLSIVDVANRDAAKPLVETIRLPQEGGLMTISPDGKLYIASAIDGIMVIDPAKKRLIGNLPTGGPVRDIAINPSGSKIFLAMGRLGLKRLSLRTGALARITDRSCPVYVGVDHRGKRLLVAYQCSGPSGRRGHDAVEIFDAETEANLGTLSGPPMVGGRISISADDSLAIVDGSDACFNPSYDHFNCPAVPSHVVYLVRAADHGILHTFGFPVGTGPEYFVGNARILMLGNSISVVDAATYTLLERLDLGRDEAVSAVFAPDGSGFWAGVKNPPGLIGLGLEPASCAATDPTPSLFFPADGSFEDLSDGTVLSPRGHVAFTAGKTGQAFFLDSHGYLLAESTGYFKIYRHNFSIAMDVKFATLDGKVALMDWSSNKPQNGIRMLKSIDGHFVFQAWPGGDELTSVSTVAANTWYHVAVTKTDDLMTLYVNGKNEASGKPPVHFAEYHDPLLLGAYEPGRPSLHGWLDEIAFYNRGLTADEVRRVYQERNSDQCRTK